MNTHAFNGTIKSGAISVDIYHGSSLSFAEIIRIILAF